MKQLKWTGQSKMNGGKMLMRAVGMAGKGWQAGKTQPAEQQLQATPPAEQGNCRQRSQRTLRPAQASQQTATDGRPRSKNTTAAADVGRSLAVQVSGGSAEVLAAMKAGSDLPTVLPHLSPLPVTVPTHSLNL